MKIIKIIGRKEYAKRKCKIIDKRNIRQARMVLLLFLLKENRGQKQIYAVTHERYLKKREPGLGYVR